MTMVPQVAGVRSGVSIKKLRTAQALDGSLTERRYNNSKFTQRSNIYILTIQLGYWREWLSQKSTLECSRSSGSLYL